MERTREMHIAERERRLAILNRLMEENDLAAMVCHGNGAMAYQADVKYMTDLATPCGHMFSMMVRGEQPIALLGRADAGFHARLKTFLDADHVVITPDMVGEICRRIEALPGNIPGWVFHHWGSIPSSLRMRFSKPGRRLWTLPRLL